MEKVLARKGYSPASHGKSIWAQLLDVVLKADSAYRSARAYRNLSDAARADMGLPAGEFWDAPVVFRAERGHGW